MKCRGTDGRTDYGQTDEHMDGQRENIIPPTNGWRGIKYEICSKVNQFIYLSSSIS